MRGSTALLLAALALTGAAPGCSPGGQVVCTEIGCSSAVSAELRGGALSGVTGPFHARICADDACTEHPDQSPERQPVLLTHEMPGAEAGQRVLMRVEVEQGGVVLFRHEEEVLLRAERPNGPRCPPVCNQRHLVLGMP